MKEWSPGYGEKSNEQIETRNFVRICPGRNLQRSLENSEQSHVYFVEFNTSVCERGERLVLCEAASCFRASQFQTDPH